MSIVGKKKLILTAPTVYATFIIVSLPSLLSANVFELTNPPIRQNLSHRYANSGGIMEKFY